jgi:hypothetical protein
MADCGVTGSALDRAISAVVGGVSSNDAASQQLQAAGKHFSSFMGNAASSSQTTPQLHNTAISSQSLMPPAMAAKAAATANAISHVDQARNTMVSKSAAFVSSNEASHFTAQHVYAAQDQNSTSFSSTGVHYPQQQQFKMSIHNNMYSQHHEQQKQMLAMQRMQYQQQEMQRMSVQLQQQMQQVSMHQQQQAQNQNNAQAINSELKTAEEKFNAAWKDVEEKEATSTARFDFLGGEENYDSWQGHGTVEDNQDVGADMTHGGATFDEMAQAWAEAEAEINER